MTTTKFASGYTRRTSTPSTCISGPGSDSPTSRHPTRPRPPFGSSKCSSTSGRGPPPIDLARALRPDRASQNWEVEGSRDSRRGVIFGKSETLLLPASGPRTSRATNVTGTPEEPGYLPIQRIAPARISPTARGSHLRAFGPLCTARRWDSDFSVTLDSRRCQCRAAEGADRFLECS